MSNSPTIVNLTRHSLVVFQERGVFFNKQILAPGEAVNIHAKDTGGPLPYYIHAVIGDERCFPTERQSMKNLASVSVIPAAFVVGAFATAMSAGTLAGPSAALAPMVSGMVVKGVVVDAAAIAAGTVMASKVGYISEKLVKKSPENFVAKKGKLRPGRRYMTVTGGVDDGPLVLDTISRRDFSKLRVTTCKSPLK